MEIIPKYVEQDEYNLSWFCVPWDIRLYVFACTWKSLGNTEL